MLREALTHLNALLILAVAIKVKADNGPLHQGIIESLVVVLVYCKLPVDIVVQTEQALADVADKSNVIVMAHDSI